MGTNEPKVCSVENCGRGAWAKGLCTTHYARAARGNVPLDAPIRCPRLATENECSVGECDRPSVTSGYCAAHYSRVLRGTDLNTEIRPKNRALTGNCEAPGCNKPAKILTFCKFHYHRNYRGTPLDAERPSDNQGRLCSEPQCLKPACSRGRCSMHYARLLRTDSVANPASSEEKFWSKVEKAEQDQCWMWRGAISADGYGTTGFRGRRGQRAHRVAWLLTHESLDPDLGVCHKCDNPPCVNPDHLFLGTAKDNVNDKVSKGRQGRGSAHGCAVISEKDVHKIRRAYDAGKRLQPVAKRIGITYSHALKIAKRLLWKHIA